MNIKKYKKALKSNKSFNALMLKLKKIDGEVNFNFSIKEVNLLISIKKNLNIDLNKLVNLLLLTTANRERLVEINNVLVLYRDILININLKVRSILEKEHFYMSLKRQDRKLYSDSILLPIMLRLNKYNSYISIVENGIDHIDKVQFNIKTIISCKKNEN